MKQKTFLFSILLSLVISHTYGAQTDSTIHSTDQKDKQTVSFVRGLIVGLSTTALVVTIILLIRKIHHDSMKQIERTNPNKVSSDNHDPLITLPPAPPLSFQPVPMGRFRAQDYQTTINSPAIYQPQQTVESKAKKTTETIPYLFKLGTKKNDDSLNNDSQFIGEHQTLDLHHSKPQSDIYQRKVNDNFLQRLEKAKNKFNL